MGFARACCGVECGENRCCSCLLESMPVIIQAASWPCYTHGTLEVAQKNHKTEKIQVVSAKHRGEESKQVAHGKETIAWGSIIRAGCHERGPRDTVKPNAVIVVSVLVLDSYSTDYTFIQNELHSCYGHAYCTNKSGQYFREHVLCEESVGQKFLGPHTTSRSNTMVCDNISILMSSCLFVKSLSLNLLVLGAFAPEKIGIIPLPETATDFFSKRRKKYLAWLSQWMLGIENAKNSKWRSKNSIARAIVGCRGWEIWPGITVRFLRGTRPPLTSALALLCEIGRGIPY